MASIRKEPDLAEFAKLVTKGAAIFGRVTRQGENTNGRFIVLEPAMFRASGTAPFKRFAELAVGLSTGLAGKISKDDNDAFLLIVFVGTKPTSKEKPMKLFNVIALDAPEVKALAGGGPLAPEWLALPEQKARATAKIEDDFEDFPGALADEDDELPF